MAMLARRLPESLGRAVAMVNFCLFGLFGLALLWYGTHFFINSTQLFMVSDFLQVSHRWVVAAVPVSGLVLCGHLLSGPGLLAERDLGAEP